LNKKTKKVQYSKAVGTWSGLYINVQWYKNIYRNTGKYTNTTKGLCSLWKV